MSLTNWAEQGWLPDRLIRYGIRRRLRTRLRDERARGEADQCVAALVETLRNSPIAMATEEANAQHYEVPAAFFETVLGPRLKYSCGHYSDPGMSLREAEESMLHLTCLRADVQDGMEILDLGCGWGSLSLWIAEKYPKCRVTALSNSRGQRRFIEAKARGRGLDNIRVITANITDYRQDGVFDRILSVEMFEHLRNYEVMLARIADWLQPAGKLFVHIFCHNERAYTFDADGDWMARHFFTGGLMPSFDLLGRFHRDLTLRESWQVNGGHYSRTCEDWLRNLDANRESLLSLLEERDGQRAARIQLQRWRMFFMACSELFRFNGGTEWFVGHYLFQPQPRVTPIHEFGQDIKDSHLDHAGAIP